MAFVFNPFTGNFDVVPDPAPPSAPTTPTKIATDKVLVVEADTQMLFTEEIDLEGEIDLDGVLVEVQ